MLYSPPTTMHGTILCGFRRYVREAYDEDVWEAVHERADVGGQLFVPVTEYPDTYYYELIDAAAGITDCDPTRLQRDFGRALVEQHLGNEVENLSDGVEHPVDGVHHLAYHVADAGGPEATIEQLANADEWVEHVLGQGGEESSPLAFTADRHGERSVRLTYGSPLGLCTVVEGILAALVAPREADWSVEEVRCMHDGGTECEFVVEAPRRRTVAAPAGQSRPPETRD